MAPVPTDATSILSALTAALPTPVIAVIWVWVLISVVVLTVRIFRRIGGPKADAGADAELPPLPGPADIPVPPGLTSTPDPTSTPSAAPGSPAESATGAPVNPVIAAAASSGPLADPAAIPTVPIIPTVPAAAAGPATGRSGFFAASVEPGEAAPSGAIGAVRPTVAEALQGIVMPCGLTPVVDGTVSIPNPFRVAFLTTDADAQAVGAGIGDELERLGYTLSTAAATELVARKPGAELRVVLYPTPSAARRGFDAIFPAAPDGAVGLELSTDRLI